MRRAARVRAHGRYLHAVGVVHGDINPKNIVRVDRELRLIDLDMAFKPDDVAAGAILPHADKTKLAGSTAYAAPLSRELISGTSSVMSVWRIPPIPVGVRGGSPSIRRAAVGKVAGPRGPTSRGELFETFPITKRAVAILVSTAESRYL